MQQLFFAYLSASSFPARSQQSSMSAPQLATDMCAFTLATCSLEWSSPTTSVRLLKNARQAPMRTCIGPVQQEAPPMKDFTTHSQSE